jgi:hypothetical protein
MDFESSAARILRPAGASRAATFFRSALACSVPISSRASRKDATTSASLDLESTRMRNGPTVSSP